MPKKKEIAQTCPKCGYEKCYTKLTLNKPEIPSGVILRCKNCKSIFYRKDPNWVYFKKWDL